MKFIYISPVKSQNITNFTFWKVVPLEIREVHLTQGSQSLGATRTCSPVFPQCRLVHVPSRQAGRAPEGTGVSPATTVDGAPDTGPPEPQHRRNTHLVPAATWRAQARAPRHSKPWSRPATASPGPDTGVRHKKGNGHVRACRVLLWAGWQLWASHHRICETEGASGFCPKLPRTVS